MASTPGLSWLAAQGGEVTLHPYDCDPSADAVGLAAARALGLDPALTLKTLMVEVDGKPACCVILSDRQLSMKKVAAMIQVPKAEKLTGYKVGGISPFGQKRAVPTAVEVTATTAERVWINAGQRGLLLGIGPGQALAVLGAQAVALVA